MWDLWQSMHVIIELYKRNYGRDKITMHLWTFCEWQSQQCLNGMPWSNIFVFSGSNAAKCLRLFQHMKLQMMSTSTFSRIQSAYVIPSCIFTWDYHLETLLQEYQGQRLTLGGDARCDSPGYSVKYGSFNGFGDREKFGFSVSSE